MALSYISKKKTIILAVSPADNDLSSSDALILQRNTDKEGKRTIGVVTKVDLDIKRAIKILQNESLTLKHGYYGMICRSQNQVQKDSLVSVKNAIQNEKNFFDSQKEFNEVSEQLLGTQNVVIKLTELFNENTRDDLPVI